MKIVLITGSHPRHAFIARSLAETGCLSAVIVEQREAFVPSAPDKIDDNLKQLFVHHFNERDRIERAVFGDVVWPTVDIVTITKEELNDYNTHRLLGSISPELLITYGCHMLTEKTLSVVSGEKWNCHGGLSPWYRGAITHFWPSYMLEPQMTGMTVHELTQQLDAGDIVHQCVADLAMGDSLHQLSAKAVQKLGDELPLLVNVLQEKQGNLKKKAHTTSGMLWPGSKWRPEHLKVIYEQYQDKVVDAYLNGELENKEPDLYRQF